MSWTRTPYHWLGFSSRPRNAMLIFAGMRSLGVTKRRDTGKAVVGESCRERQLGSSAAND